MGSRDHPGIIGRFLSGVRRRNLKTHIMFWAFNYKRPYPLPVANIRIISDMCNLSPIDLHLFAVPLAVMSDL